MGFSRKTLHGRLKKGMDMKKIVPVISLLCPVLVLLVFSFPSICFSEPDSKVWQSFSDNWYYNKTNITKSSNLVSIWTYKIVTDDYRKQVIETSKKYDLELARQYQAFDHFISLWEIDCKKKVVRIKNSVDYNDRWKIIYKHAYKDGEWQKIVSSAPMAKLYNKVCAIPRKPSKKK